MRNHYQRRSLTSCVIWTTALVTIALVAAWQFHWWPTTEMDPAEFVSKYERPLSGDSSSTLVRQASHERPDEEQKRDVFANQTEPDLPELPSEIPPANRPDFRDFPKPPQLLPANPDAKPIPQPSRLVQTVEGDLPPWKPQEETPAEFAPDSSIQLLAEETKATPETASPFAEPTAPDSPFGEPPTYQPPATDLPPELASVADKIKQIDEWMASSDPKQELSAHKELSTLYWDHPEWREALRSRIEKTAKSIYFAKQPHYMTPYTVQPGDQLTKVGKLYHVPWEYLASLNQVDPRKVRVGQKLKVIKGPFAAVVDLARFELTIQHHGFFVKRYKVGIGKDGTTPIGEFTIKNKLVNPTYYGPEGNVIDADDPKNPIGEYWIDIGDSYGIHGTIEPDSIGKAESAGCIRMLNEDVAEVYGFLGLGAKVIIRR